MTDYIDVPVDQVQVGDEVRVDGYGVVRKRGTTAYTTGEAYPVHSMDWMLLQAFNDPDSVTLRGFAAVEVGARRSSIVSARRRKPEPKPGDWRCRKEDGSVSPCIWNGEKEHCHNPSEVYRASGGWSRDTRTGEPWVMREDAPAEFVIRCKPDDTITAFRNAEKTILQAWPPREGENVTDYYRRIGLDVRPVDRRKR